MLVESEYLLMGTGLAPLIVARHLQAEGKTVAILNPDSDFFLEDSEWPIELVNSDEFFGSDGRAISSEDPEKIHALLQSEYPGAMEYWVKPDSQEFHDVDAPHVRVRSRLLMWEHGKQQEKIASATASWRKNLDDRGIRWRECDGLTALRRFPGASQKSRADLVQGLILSGAFDVDVARYRNNILEFIRERLGGEQVFTSVSGFELDGAQVRFRQAARQVQANHVKKIFMFWTPRLAAWASPWVRHWAGADRLASPGHCYWEKWSLESRDKVFHDPIATFDDLTVWAEVLGPPPVEGSQRISVLRSELGAGAAPRWASEKSFQLLSRLFHDLLGWDKFTVNSMKSGIWFDWNHFSTRSEDSLRGTYQRVKLPSDITLYWVGNSEGPIHRIVKQSQILAEGILSS